MLLSKSPIIHYLKKIAHGLKLKCGGYQKALDYVAKAFGYTSWFDLNKNFDITFIAHKKVFSEEGNFSGYGEERLYVKVPKLQIPYINEIYDIADRDDIGFPLSNWVEMPTPDKIRSMGYRNVTTGMTLAILAGVKFNVKVPEVPEVMLENMEKMLLPQWHPDGFGSTSFTPEEDVRIEIQGRQVMEVFNDLSAKSRSEYPDTDDQYIYDTLVAGFRRYHARLTR
jgi:hypothetical protein